MNPATSPDVALWSQFVPQADQTSAWSNDSGNTQALLGFDSIIDGPVTVGRAIAGVKLIGSALATGDANSPMAPTSSSYSGGLDYLNPASSKVPDHQPMALTYLVASQGFPSPFLDSTPNSVMSPASDDYWTGLDP